MINAQIKLADDKLPFKWKSSDSIFYSAVTLMTLMLSVSIKRPHLGLDTGFFSKLVLFFLFQ